MDKTTLDYANRHLVEHLKLAERWEDIEGLKDHPDFGKQAKEALEERKTPINWYQLYVKAPEGNGYSNPQAAKRVDDHLTGQFAAAFVAPDGIPIQNSAGEYEVRVHVPAQLGMVKMILQRHYGLEIVREVGRE